MIRVTISPAGAPRELTIQEFAHGSLTVGRDPTNNIVLPGGRVGARHVDVLVNDASLTLFDRSGGIGTFVNGELVTRPVKIGANDAVDVPGFTLRFASIPDESPAIVALTRKLRLEAARLVPSASEPSDVPDRLARLHEEIRKESSAGPQVDWSTVAELGQDLLQRRAQDLRVAVYTAFALYHTRGAEGLALGLMLVDTLIASCWDALEPPRTRGRVMAIEWLLEHIIARARDPRVTRPDPDTWSVVRAASERLEICVRTSLGDHAPAFAAWSTAMRHTELGPRISRTSLTPEVQDELHNFLKTRGEPTPPAVAESNPASGASPPTAPPPTATPPTATSPAPALPTNAPDTVTIAEERHLEVALPRTLTEQAGVPLHVLLRIPGTPTLLDRLGRAGPHEWTAQDQKRSAAWVDYRLDPRGAPVPLSVVVSLHGEDFDVSEPRKRVRLSCGHDAPLLTFFVAPRRPGPVNLTIEVKLEDDVVGSENIWRVCLGRSAAPSDLRLAYSSQSTPLLATVRPPAHRPHRSGEYHLHALLMALFSPEELHCWVRLRYPEWSLHLPSSAASLNETACAVIDTGARHGRLDAAFFDALAAQFPRRADQIAGVRAEFSP